MEKAGKEVNAAQIHKYTPGLLRQYERYQKILAPYFEEEKDRKIERKNITSEKLKELFEELREALDSLDMDGMERVMKKMEDYEYPADQVDMYEQLKNAVMEIDSETSEEILQLWEKNI